MCIKGESIGSIAKHLNLLGYRNKTGNPFDSRRIKYILENPVYIGVTRWNYTHCQGTKIVLKPENEWIVVENTHEPIIDKKIWDEAQNALKAWHRDVKPRSTDYIHWLGGILRCSKCGGTLVYKTARFKRKDGSIRIADGYQCGRYKSRSCDTSNYIHIKDAESHVLNILINTLSIVNDTWSLEEINIENRNKDKDSELYEMQLNKLNHKLELAKKAYLNEIDTIDEYKANKEAIQKEIYELENIINNNKVDDVNIEKFKNKLITAIDAIQDNSISIKGKNKILKEFIKAITYNKAEESFTANFYI